MIAWRVWTFAMWFGVMFAVCTVATAAALILILGAVIYGLVAPSRTPASCLRSLAANSAAGLDQIRTLRRR